MTAGSARLIEIRDRQARGESLRHIARQLGISHVRVLQILRAADRVVRVSAPEGLTPAH